jgi:organic hydroperoxide reductase OsmC/OhrA
MDCFASLAMTAGRGMASAHNLRISDEDILEDHVPTGKTYKTFQYSNNLVWDTARRGRTSAPGKPDIEIGSPPEFKGEAGVWAPEEMLVAALNACMMLTFVSFAQSKRLAFVAYESTAEGLLENVDGKYRIV